ncbi:hypothetical protein Salat_1133600 [Sesamum alatum]|uniref:Uncharacterized protein n=1 Tax=Sesamum alatum TaxID=300844 RepID=A0AAE1YDZ6_9LAMI|nr:hypothetical protein Salat_1133600 [Sesamum alatum]
MEKLREGPHEEKEYDGRNTKECPRETLQNKDAMEEPPEKPYEARAVAARRILRGPPYTREVRMRSCSGTKVVQESQKIWGIPGKIPQKILYEDGGSTSSPKI